jgi:hypothetical protein
MIVIADLTLHALHIGVSLINLLGWIPRRTRVLQRWVIALTLLSWLALSPWFGLGYCFLTDWHWQVLRARGRTALPSSYTELLAEAVAGRDFSPQSVALWTAIGLAMGVAGCAVMWVRGRRRRRT